MIKKLIASAKAFWASLPHQVQAPILLFATMAGSTLAKELQALFAGNEAFTWFTLRHDIALAITAGVIAVRCFYMLPNKQPVVITPQPTSQSGLQPTAVSQSK